MKKLLPLLLILIIFSCASKKGGIKIGYIPITHAAPLYLVETLNDEKFFNIELIKFTGWAELMDALNTGRIDGASVLIQLAIRSVELGVDLKVVALGHRDGNVIVTETGITKTANLQNKNFAIPHKFSSHNILLYKMLKNAGMQYSDVNIIELPPPEMAASLVEKRISGYCVAEPFGAKSVYLNTGKVLYHSSDIWENSMCCALVLRGEFIRTQKNTAENFFRRYTKAANYIEDNKESAKNIIKDYLKVEREVLDLSMEWINFKNLKTSQEDYDDLSNSMKELNLMKNIPKFDNIIDNSFFDLKD